MGHLGVYLEEQVWMVPSIEQMIMLYSLILLEHAAENDIARHYMSLSVSNSKGTKVQKVLHDGNNDCITL